MKFYLKVIEKISVNQANTLNYMSSPCRVAVIMFVYDEMTLIYIYKCELS